MNVFAKFDEIPSMILKVMKETKRYGYTVGRSVGQNENSIPSHKHSLRGGINIFAKSGSISIKQNGSHITQGSSTYRLKICQYFEIDLVIII